MQAAFRWYHLEGAEEAEPIAPGVALLGNVLDVLKCSSSKYF